MAIGEIKAKELEIQEKDEKENSPIIVHLGVFFDSANLHASNCTQLVTLYSPPEDETNRKYTIVISPGECPTVDEQFDVDALNEFGKRLGDVLYHTFDRLNEILSGYFSNASDLTIEIDTFCVEDGFFSASLFCEAIEPGCYDAKPPYAEMALAVVQGGGILDDLRMRGATIILHSFTTFQVAPETTIKTDTAMQANLEHGKSREIRKTDRNRIGNSNSISNINNYQEVELEYDYGINPRNDKYEYIRSSEDKSHWYIKIKTAKYEGIYSNLCTAKDWLENIALTADIAAISTSITGIGLPAGAVAEVISMGASGVSAIVCVSLAAMDIVNGDNDSRNAHLWDIGFNAVGALPFGTLIAKGAKGAKFSTKVSSVHLKNLNVVNTKSAKSNVSKAVVSSIDEKASNIVNFPSSRISVDNVADSLNNTSKGVDEVLDAAKSSNVTYMSEYRAQTKVTKQEQQYLRQANGPDILVTKTSYESEGVIFDSVDKFRSVNYVSFPTWSRVSRGVTHGAQNISSKNNSIFGVKKIDSINSQNPVDFNLDKMHGQERIINIKTSREEAAKFLHELQVKFVKLICKITNLSID